MRLGGSSRMLKRLVDISVSSLLLLLLSPILPRSRSRSDSSPGRAVYRQPRRGRNGATFRIAKFRTMHVGAEQRRADVLHLNRWTGRSSR